VKGMPPSAASLASMKPALLWEKAKEEPADFRKLQAALERNAPVTGTTEPTLARLILDAVSHPGSLFRARLTAGTAEALGLESRQAEHLACIVEYDHLASLLLDDLPCMDDAAERRGRICAHLLHGEAPAILGAIALITRAYALLGGLLVAAPISAQREAVGFVEMRLGTIGILNGQAFDLAAGERKERRGAAWIAMRKTVPLIDLALGLPALLAGSGKREAGLLRRLAVYWGLAYQAMDDFKDVWSHPAKSGKTAQRDVLLGRPNASMEMGSLAARRYLFRLLRLAEETVAQLAEGRAALAFLKAFSGQIRSEWERVEGLHR